MRRFCSTSKPSRVSPSSTWDLRREGRGRGEGRGGGGREEGEGEGRGRGGGGEGRGEREGRGGGGEGGEGLSKHNQDVSDMRVNVM